MNTIKTLAIAFVAVLVAASAYAADTRGKLLDIKHDGSVIVKTEILGLAGPEEKNVKFEVTKDAAWVICLSGQCTEKRGAEGIKLFNYYLQYEAYGLSPLGANIKLHEANGAVKGVQVNL